MTLFHSKPKFYVSRSIEEFNKKSGVKIGGYMNPSNNKDVIGNSTNKSINFKSHGNFNKIFQVKKLLENLNNLQAIL